MTKKRNILNTLKLNILQKIILKENNTLIFYFGDTPNWRENCLIKDFIKMSDYYEVFKIQVNLDSKTLTELYWKIHRYSGQEMFLEVDNNYLNIWEGEISDYEEYWGSFDDLEDELPLLKYEKYTELKNAIDWKTDYESLRANFYSLYNKKNFQIKEFREKIKQELKEKINTRIEQKKQSKKNYSNSESFTEQEINDIINLAFDDFHNGIKVDLFTEFIYDRK